MEMLEVSTSRLTDSYGALWARTPAGIPAHLRRFSPAEKTEKEREVELLLEKTLPKADRFREMNGEDRSRYLGKAHTALGRLLIRDPDPRIDRFFSDCEAAGKEFVRRARAFDPSLTDGNIHQALRNQWVFNSIQSSLDRSVTLTSSSLGYSLMYPYTDNWLDEEGHTEAEKQAFNQSLKECLDGSPGPDDERTCRAFPALVRLIEDEYPRGSYPLVFESLHAIHRAQQRSLILHGPVEDREEAFLQGLTIEKGGTSVAVDGYLVSGDLAPAALHALFGYGVVLQFIDDLQDIAEDADAAHSTMFTRACRRGPLDDLTGRLLHFTCRTIRLLDFPGSRMEGALSALVESSCVFLILEAVARHSRQFSAPFVRSLGEYSPLRFPYLAGLHDRVRRAMAGASPLLFDSVPA